MMIKYLLALAALCAFAYGEDLKSPCPELFEYGAVEKGKYEATIVLKSDAKLYGVWARLFFDKPVNIEKLPAGYEAVKYEDKKGILIKNSEIELAKNAPAKIPIVVTYEGETVPKLTQFRLNARNQCPADE